MERPRECEQMDLAGCLPYSNPMSLSLLFSYISVPLSIFCEIKYDETTVFPGQF